MLFHGIHKLFAGIDGISGMLVAKGFPGFVAYGVLIGEVVAPILIILGILTRPAALVIALTMVVAWLMVGMGKTGMLDKTGAWAIESLVYFLLQLWPSLFLVPGVMPWQVILPGDNSLKNARLSLPGIKL